MLNEKETWIQKKKKYMLSEETRNLTALHGYKSIRKRRKEMRNLLWEKIRTSNEEEEEEENWIQTNYLSRTNKKMRNLQYMGRKVDVRSRNKKLNDTEK